MDNQLCSVIKTLVRVEIKCLFRIKKTMTNDDKKEFTMLLEYDK